MSARLRDTAPDRIERLERIRKGSPTGEHRFWARQRDTAMRARLEAQIAAGNIAPLPPREDRNGQA